jgi:hypothetical protein
MGRKRLDVLPTSSDSLNWCLHSGKKDVPPTAEYSHVFMDSDSQDTHAHTHVGTRTAPHHPPHAGSSPLKHRRSHMGSTTPPPHTHVLTLPSGDPSGFTSTNPQVQSPPNKGEALRPGLCDV